MLRTILKNTAANYLLKATQLLLNVLAIPVMIANLGEEAFGIVLFANIVIGYFNVLELGITDGVTKYVSQYLESKDYLKLQNILNTSLIFFIGIGFTIFIIMMAWVLLGGIAWLKLDDSLIDNSEEIFLYAGCIALLSWPQLLLKGVFKGIQDFVTLNALLGIGRIVSVSMALLAVSFTTWELQYIFLILNFDKIILTFIEFRILKKKLPFWKFSIFNFDRPTFTFIFSFSGWIMLGQLAVMLEYQADQLIILKYLSPAFLTKYAVIFYLFRLIQQISGLAGSPVMPAISKLNESADRKVTPRFIFAAVKMHNLVFVPITITLFYISEPFIRLWVGADYLDFLWLIKLSIIFQLLWQANALFGQIYLGLGYSRKPGLVGVAVGVLNVALSIIFVNHIGLPGVVLATICVGTAAVPLASYWMLKDVNVKFRFYWVDVIGRTQLPLVIGSIVFFFVRAQINVIHSWLVLSFTAISMLVYLFVVAFIFCLNREEKVWVKSRLSIESLF